MGILIKKRYKNYITTWEAINENMIKLHMSLFGKKLCILEIYAISDDENVLVKEYFWGKLNKVIFETGNSREILIAGDFNSRTGRKINNLVVGPFGEELINNNGNKLICVKKFLKFFLNCLLAIRLEDTSVYNLICCLAIVPWKGDHLAMSP